MRLLQILLVTTIAYLFDEPRYGERKEMPIKLELDNTDLSGDFTG